MLKEKIGAARTVLTKYGRDTHYLFLLIGLIFGFTFVFITPPLWGLDETAHFEQVYRIAHGDMIPVKESTTTYGGDIPKSFVDLANFVGGDLTDNGKDALVTNRKDMRDAADYKRLTGAEISEEKVHVSQLAAYSPVAYVGPVIGVVLADSVHANLGNTLFLARIFSLIVYVVLGWYAIRLLRSYKLKWLFMLVLLMPTALFEASVVTADGMLIGMSALLIALFIRLVDLKENSDNKKLFYVFASIAALLPLIKPNYIILSALILFIPNTIFSTRRLTLIIKIAILTITGLLVLLWNSLTKVTGDVPISIRSDGQPISAGEQVAFIVHHPLHFLVASMRTVTDFGSSFVSDAIGLIGLNYIKAPLIAIIIICLGLSLAGLYAKRESISIQKIFLPLFVIIGLGIASTFVALYLVFSPVGGRMVEGLQGRYFLPFLIPIIMVLTAYLPIDVRIKDKTAAYIFVAIPVLALIASIGTFYLATY